MVQLQGLVLNINPNSHNSQFSSKSNFEFNSQFDLKRRGEASCPIAAISAPDIYFVANMQPSHTTQTGKIIILINKKLQNH